VILDSENQRKVLLMALGGATWQGNLVPAVAEVIAAVQSAQTTTPQPEADAVVGRPMELVT
jgi:hypothetical protein